MEESALQHPKAFRKWLEDANSEEPAEQDPIQQLLAEHHLINIVVSTLEVEGGRLAHREPLRVDFWADIVDFIGNFVHLCHRRKEEQHCFPALYKGAVASGNLVVEVSKEHKKLEELTLELCSAVENADWESVLRFTPLYSRLMKRHLQREEELMFAHAETELSGEVLETMQSGFRDADQQGLRGLGRKHYLEVARRLCSATELPDPLAQ